MIQIQASIIGYGGRPCSLYSAYDPASKVLVVGAEGEYRRERREGCIVITNEPDIPRDKLFTEDDLAAAINAYYALKQGVAADNKSARIVFADRAVRANPDQSIEKDGISENGQKFRLSEGISCAQIAALATCAYAIKSETVDRAIAMSRRFRDLSFGRIISI